MKRPVSMPFKNWPAVDREMWRGLLLPGGPLDDHGALLHVRPATQKSLKLHYGRWLEWLFQTHPSTLEFASPTRATAERLIDWTTSLTHTSPHSQEMFINATVRVLKAAAPDLDWSQQIRLGQSLRRRAALSISDRKNGRVLDSAVLLRAGLDLAGSHPEGAPSCLTEAKRFRDGTMLAFLTLLPMRRRAFGLLELGSSVVVSEKNIQIALPGGLTKNGRPWEAPVPDTLLATLQYYIAHVRPWLLNRNRTDHNFLWIGDRGKPYPLNYLGTRIADITERQLGIRIYPHLFRDAAATSLSRYSPENARQIRPLLGHSSHGTAERHYIQAQSIETGRTYAAMLDDLFSEED